MPRRPRLAAGDLAYHVLNRRVGRLPLFEKPDEKKMKVMSCNPTFRDVWRGAGSSGCFGLSRVCGSTSETSQPRAPERLPLNRHPLTQGSHNTAVAFDARRRNGPGRPLESRMPRFFYLETRRSWRPSG